MLIYLKEKKNILCFFDGLRSTGIFNNHLEQIFTIKLTSTAFMHATLIQRTFFLYIKFKFKIIYNYLERHTQKPTNTQYI